MTKEEKRAITIIIISVLLIFLVSFSSLFMGRYDISLSQGYQIIYHKIIGVPSDDMAARVVWEIRLPRVLMSLLVGGGLAASGTAFQGVFQNRLVSPDILGVSNGAGFGAALAMILGSTLTVGVAPMAFVGGIISVILTYSISKIKKDQSALALVLSGIIVASFFSALISYIKLVADTESVLPSITYWLMGSFASSNFDKIAFASTFIIGGLIVLLLMRWKINILSMGDDEAYTLGINPKRNRLVIIIACTLITAASVTVAGIIGWVGMIMPNICREYVSANNRYLLPASIVIGGLFMVCIDLVARCATAAEIPIGILTAIVGAPIFVLVFFKKEGVNN
jgi:iron complex transport system permease protein